MTSLTADDATVATLSQTNELAEVRDQNGKVMGFFVPLDIYAARLYVENHHSFDFVRIFCGKYRGTFGDKTMRQVFERLKTLTNDQASNANLQGYIDRMQEEERSAFFTPK